MHLAANLSYSCDVRELFSLECGGYPKTGQTHFTGGDNMFTFSQLSFGLLAAFRHLVRRRLLHMSTIFVYVLFPPVVFL